MGMTERYKFPSIQVFERAFAKFNGHSMRDLQDVEYKRERSVTGTWKKGTEIPHGFCFCASGSHFATYKADGKATSMFKGVEGNQLLSGLKVKLSYHNVELELW